MNVIGKIVYLDHKDPMIVIILNIVEINTFINAIYKKYLHQRFIFKKNWIFGFGILSALTNKVMILTSSVKTNIFLPLNKHLTERSFQTSLLQANYLQQSIRAFLKIRNCILMNELMQSSSPPFQTASAHLSRSNTICLPYLYWSRTSNSLAEVR